MKDGNNEKGTRLSGASAVPSMADNRQTEESLREAEPKYRSFFENACEGIFQTTLDGKFITANYALAQMLGFDSAEEMIAARTDIAHEHYVDPQRRDEFKRLLDATGVVLEFELEAYRKDGSRVWLSENVRAVRDESGEVQYFEGTCLDITERRRAEEALRESEERYRELFENAKDAIYVHDLTGRYTSVNLAAERLSGFTREEILGKHFSNFVAPRDLKYARTNLCRKLDEENETIYEVDMVRRDGQRVPVEISSRLIYEKGVAVGVQGTARDITERKRAQDALRMYSQRLMEVQEVERDNIARELQQQIGQALAAVRTNLQSIQRSSRTADGVPPLDESIRIVDEALERVRELSIELRPSLLDDLGLSVALRQYVDRYAQRTGIIAEVLNGFKDDSRLPRELETACFRITQEALTNVARHAHAVSVSVQLERFRERMLLTIMDDGVGFDIANLRKSASEASALGLRGMEERALAVGGYVEIDSGAGRGTRVRATFPFKQR
jgi:PAS domain S-box-containing protein